MTEETISEAQKPEDDLKSTANPPRTFILKYAQEKFRLISRIVLIVWIYTLSVIFRKCDNFPQFTRCFPVLKIFSFIAMVFAGFKSRHYASVRNTTLVYFYLFIFAITAGFHFSIPTPHYFFNAETHLLLAMLSYCLDALCAFQTNKLGVFFKASVTWVMLLITLLVCAIYVDYNWSQWERTLVDIVYLAWNLNDLLNLISTPSSLTVRRPLLDNIIGFFILSLNVMYDFQIAQKTDQQLTDEKSSRSVYTHSIFLFEIILQMIGHSQTDLEREKLE